MFVLLKVPLIALFVTILLTMSTLAALSQEPPKVDQGNLKNAGATDPRLPLLIAAENLRRRHNVNNVGETDQSLVQLFKHICELPSSQLSSDDLIDMKTLAASSPVAAFIREQLTTGSASASTKYGAWRNEKFKSTKLRRHRSSTFRWLREGSRKPPEGP